MRKIAAGPFPAERIGGLVHRFDEIDHMGVGFIFAETTCSLTA
jgi:hypothetical protein